MIDSDNRVIRYLVRGVDLVAVITLFVIMAHTVANVVLRTLTNQPLAGTFEQVTFWYMPIAAFFSILAAQGRDQHIETDLVFSRLPWRNKFEVRVVGLFISAFTAGAFTYFTYLKAVRDFGFKQVSTGVHPVPTWPVTMILPVLFACLTLQFLLLAIRVIRTKDLGSAHETPEPDPEPESLPTGATLPAGGSRPISEPGDTSDAASTPAEGKQP